MKPVLSPAAMQRADRTAIEQLGIPSIVLMENAARSAAEILRQLRVVQSSSRVLILCGSGNNGGDGFALARQLHEDAAVRILLAGSPERMSSETAANFAACQQLGIDIINWNEVQSVERLPTDATVIVDALLGIGARGAPRSPVTELVRWANGQPATRVALDMPSGLDAETGITHDPCFRAHYTVTMGALKTGLMRNDAPDYCGSVHVASIGIPRSVLEREATVWLLEEEDAAAAYVPRSPRTTKFDYGRVLVVAGSAAMPGAAALCANAAVAAGAGLVELLTPSVHAALFPEVMPTRYEQPQLDEAAIPLVEQRAERATAVVIGPGLGAELATVAFARSVIRSLAGKKPVVADADALRAVDPTLPAPLAVLTPHRGELARMLGVSAAELRTTAHEHACELSRATGAVVVLKDFPVQISTTERVYWSVLYNPALATGGTGDVLAGTIAALCAQHYDPPLAAWLGVLLHAQAGQLASRTHGDLATRASHLIEALSEVSRQLSGR